jgi:hypothetical protein
MEETYKGFKITYNEEKSWFEAVQVDGNEEGMQIHFTESILKAVKRDIDKYFEEQAGFKPFEVYYVRMGDLGLGRGRVTSVTVKTAWNEGEAHIARVTCKSTNKEGGKEFRAEFAIGDLLSRSTPSKAIDEVLKLVEQRDALDKDIKEAIQKLPRLTPEEIWPKGVPKGA